MHTHSHGRFGMTQILLPGRMRCCSLTRCISSSTSRKRNLPNWEHSGEMGWNGFCEVVTAATTLSFLPLPGTSRYYAAAAAVAYRRHKVIDIARCLTDGTAEPHVHTHAHIHTNTLQSSRTGRNHGNHHRLLVSLPCTLPSTYRPNANLCANPKCDTKHKQQQKQPPNVARKERERVCVLRMCVWWWWPTFLHRTEEHLPQL